MNDLLSLMHTLYTTRPTESELIAPRTYRRRATWIPVEGEKVTVWRLQSHDPDRQQAYPGVFVSATNGPYGTYTVLIDGEETVSEFRKKDSHGATLWFLGHRGTQHTDLENTND